eukprot:533371-Rhodomonas_salina.1
MHRALEVRPPSFLALLAFSLILLPSPPLGKPAQWFFRSCSLTSIPGFRRLFAHLGVRAACWLLTHGALRQDGGMLTIVTDNRWYAMLLLKIVAALNNAGLRFAPLLPCYMLRVSPL